MGNLENGYTIIRLDNEPTVHVSGLNSSEILGSTSEVLFMGAVFRSQSTKLAHQQVRLLLIHLLFLSVLELEDES